MGQFECKQRLVNFRVTEHEHAVLREAALKARANSLSEFCRSRVLNSVHSAQEVLSQDLREKLAELQQVVEGLSPLLKEIRKRV